jgi:hypothetical protein
MRGWEGTEVACAKRESAFECLDKWGREAACRVHLLYKIEPAPFFVSNTPHRQPPIIPINHLPAALDSQLSPPASFLHHDHPNHTLQEGESTVATGNKPAFFEDALLLTADLIQAASAIESLKMSDSPAKKLTFDAANKENSNVAVPIVGIPDDIEIPEKSISTAPTIKAEEANEPLLQENPQRFVLFPIQNHEVGALRRVIDA